MINKTVKVFTAFSGIDAQCQALDRLVKKHNFSYELVGWSEIDKYACMAHDLIYPQWKDRNYGDVTKIDWSKVPDFDLLTWSSPCQSISVAGLRAGMTKGTGTTSSLIWSIEGCLNVKTPKYIVVENVKALVGGKNKADWESWLGYAYKLRLQALLKGGRKRLNHAPFMVKGFRLFDLVEYQKELFYVFARRKSSYFDIRRLDGSKVNKGSISCKKLRLVEIRRTLLTERRNSGSIPPRN